MLFCVFPIYLQIILWGLQFSTIVSDFESIILRTNALWTYYLIAEEVIAE